MKLNGRLTLIPANELTLILPPTPPKGTMFARAIRRHCPICGGGPLFVNWLKMKEHCSSCGIRMRRGEDGYTLGALWFNLFLADRTLFLAFDLCIRPLDQQDMT